MGSNITHYPWQWCFSMFIHLINCLIFLEESKKDFKRIDDERDENEFQ